MMQRSSNLIMNKVLLLNRTNVVLSKSAYVMKRVLSTSSSVSVPKRVVVFDIDDTLCNLYNNLNCSKFSFVVSGCPASYFAFPHLDSLTNYLLSKNVRIAIFSAGVEYRNLPLCESLFTSIYGANKYQNLKTEGQFEVFSRHHHQKLGNEMISDKDLRIVLKPDETIDNSLLIDDKFYCCMSGQENNFTIVPEIIGFQNYGYYFIGLFKSYFESDLCDKLSMSQFMSEKIIFHLAEETHWENEEARQNYIKQRQQSISIQFILDMVKMGLGEVRKTTPNAVVYDYDKFIRKVQNFIHKTPNFWTSQSTIDKILCSDSYHLLKSDDEIHDVLINQVLCLYIVS
jgi:hypothetical protein